MINKSITLLLLSLSAGAHTDKLNTDFDGVNLYSVTDDDFYQVAYTVEARASSLVCNSSDPNCLKRLISAYDEIFSSFNYSYVNTYENLRKFIAKVDRVTKSAPRSLELIRLEQKFTEIWNSWFILLIPLTQCTNDKECNKWLNEYGYKQQPLHTKKSTGSPKWAIDAALKSYGNVSADGERITPFAIEKDLNQDGIFEVLVSESSMCGSAGCTYNVYTYTSDKTCEIGYVSDPLPIIPKEISCETILKND